MRNHGLILLLALFMVGCGAKKRASYTRETNENAKQTAVSPVEGDAGTGYAMPEDKGEFIYFPIASIEEYISTFAPVAELEMKAYGIPASITLAQGILESGYGQGELTRKTNNHFGIKCHTGWEGAYENHDDDEKGECFRKYNHPMYSFRDHSIFLSSRARYAPLFELRKDDYKGWAKGLKAAGYATDHHYPQKLISFIERYGLHRFDEEVMEEGGIVARPKADPPSADEYAIHIVQQGDTLYSLSRRYLTTVPELMQLNNMESSSLSVGQQLRVRSQSSKR
jgi:flagellum-specific peptidoglycan hydrolase FlgJ